MDIKAITKEANEFIDNLSRSGDFLTQTPRLLMNQLSEEDKIQVNKLVDIDQTDLGAIKKLMKDLKNKQNAD